MGREGSRLSPWGNSNTSPNNHGFREKGLRKRGGNHKVESYKKSPFLKNSCL
jgi:hypothetical protein